jgi:radical SAM protein with 4Fe4S-binding SPASM domain
MYAGEGEPFLHPEMARITNATKAAGIDASFTTNAALFCPEIADECLKNVEWLKVSINAGTEKTYAKIHRCRPEDFEKVFANMSYAHRLRRRKDYKATLGMQLVLLPDNAGEVETLARRAKEIGMDYLVVKPYSQHPLSKTRLYRDIRYSEYEALSKRLQKHATKDFSVIFRLNTMRKWDAAAKRYGKCSALPFWTYVDAGGNVWGCSMFLGKKEFLYGNLMESSFKKVWEGARRKRSLKMVSAKLDTSNCRINCRMDEVNAYLWDLRHPPAHVNFI